MTELVHIINELPAGRQAAANLPNHLTKESDSGLLRHHSNQALLAKLTIRQGLLYWCFVSTDEPLGDVYSAYTSKHRSLRLPFVKVVASPLRCFQVAAYRFQDVHPLHLPALWQALVLNWTK